MNKSLIIMLSLTMLTQAACLTTGTEDRSIFSDSTQDIPDLSDETCNENEYVSQNSCLMCEEGFINPAGDNPKGPDTRCKEDPCFKTLNIMCDQFNEAYIKASNAEPGDIFGHSIALHNDTLVVGAIAEDSNAMGISPTNDQDNNSSNNSGAVYVFVRQNGQWAQEAYIKSPKAKAQESFGSAVAIEGDTLAVGVISEGNDANGEPGGVATLASGAVYVFDRTGSTWTQTDYLKAPIPSTNEQFGAALALNQGTLAVGAPGESSDAQGINQQEDNERSPYSGAVYIFTRQPSGWFKQAYIKASNAGEYDTFGDSIALDGKTLVVGAPTEDGDAKGTHRTVTSDVDNENATNSGAVYVFTRNSSDEWSQQAYIKASNTSTKDEFGQSIALSQDTLVVGAIMEDSRSSGIDRNQENDTFTDSGAVYVFTRSNAEWSQEAYIKASNTGDEDNFGCSVAIQGDTLAVGAYGESSNATNIEGDQTDDSVTNSGAVYLFERTSTGWLQKAYMKAPHTNAQDYYGIRIALDGDTLAVAADGDSSDAQGIDGAPYQGREDERMPSGAAYIHLLAPAP